MLTANNTLKISHLHTQPSWPRIPEKLINNNNNNTSQQVLKFDFMLGNMLRANAHNLCHLHNKYGSKYFNYSHFTQKKTETHRGYERSLRPHRGCKRRSPQLRHVTSSTWSTCCTASWAHFPPCVPVTQTLQWRDDIPSLLWMLPISSVKAITAHSEK